MLVHDNRLAGIPAPFDDFHIGCHWPQEKDVIQTSVRRFIHIFEQRPVCHRVATPGGILVVNLVQLKNRNAHIVEFTVNLSQLLSSGGQPRDCDYHHIRNL